MTAKHTPGPWRVDHKLFVWDAAGGLICDVSNSVRLKRAANARLIAAAPDMLTLLREIASDPGWPWDPKDFRPLIDALLVRIDGPDAAP